MAFNIEREKVRYACVHGCGITKTQKRAILSHQSKCELFPDNTAFIKAQDVKDKELAELEADVVNFYKTVRENLRTYEASIASKTKGINYRFERATDEIELSQNERLCPITFTVTEEVKEEII